MGSLPCRQSSMNFPIRNPSHRLQFFTNCSSAGPFYRLKSFRNRLLQRGFPLGSQLLPANLLKHGLFFQGAHRAYQEFGEHRLPMGSQPPAASTCSSMRSFRGCRWASAPLWTSMVLRGTSCFTMVYSTGCGGFAALGPRRTAPPPSSLTLVTTKLFLSHILTPLLPVHNCSWAVTFPPP